MSVARCFLVSVILIAVMRFSLSAQTFVSRQNPSDLRMLTYNGH